MAYYAEDESRDRDGQTRLPETRVLRQVYSPEKNGCRENARKHPRRAHQDRLQEPPEQQFLDNGRNRDAEERDRKAAGHL